MVMSELTFLLSILFQQNLRFQIYNTFFEKASEIINKLNYEFLFRYETIATSHLLYVLSIWSIVYSKEDKSLAISQKP
jgi:hypothetical protein